MEQEVARFTLSPKMAFISILVDKIMDLSNQKSELGRHFVHSYCHEEKLPFESACLKFKQPKNLPTEFEIILQN